MPGRVRAGFMEEVTFALGPANRNFQAEKNVKGIQMEVGERHSHRKVREPVWEMGSHWCSGPEATLRW